MSAQHGDVDVNLIRAAFWLLVAGTILFAIGLVGSEYDISGFAAVGFGLSFVAFATLIPTCIALVYQRVVESEGRGR